VLAGVSFSPSTISWASTSSLPVALQGSSAVIAPIGVTSYLYVLGGNTASAGAANAKSANVATVYFDAIDDATGALVGSSWSPTSPLPAPCGFAAAVVATGMNSKVLGNGTIYVLGGLDASGAATSAIWAASLNADGTIFPSGAGSWTSVGSLPQPLFGHAAAIVHGRIYVAGGNDASGNPVDTVYSAAVNGDGSLGTWTVLPALPAKLAYHQLVADAGNLYVIGGDGAAIDPTANAMASASSAIYRAGVDFTTGGLAGAAWITNANLLSKAREKASAVAAGGYLLVSGGLYNGALTGSSEESYASLNADGSVGSFNGATGAHTIAGSTGGYDFFNQASALFVGSDGRPHVLILGGQDVNSGALHAEVWYQP
jgi:N-acetylneuraminic acid mutarotase